MQLRGSLDLNRFVLDDGCSGEHTRTSAMALSERLMELYHLNGVLRIKSHCSGSEERGD